MKIYTNFSIPPEPINIKNAIKRTYFYAKIGKISDKEDKIKNFAVWFGMLFPRYLWSHLRSELKSYGVSWPRFLEILSLATDYISQWAIDNKLSWNSLMRIIINLLEKESL